jgi:hypothetical protein
MSELVDDGRDRSVEMVAAVSLPLVWRAPWPATTARFADIDATRSVVRAIGMADLALAVGLHFGRPSWPRLMARAATNPVIAAVSVASSPVVARPAARRRPCGRHSFGPPDRRPAPRCQPLTVPHRRIVAQG